MVRKNRFTKALKHLKSTELDEKIQSLKEAPTNKTTGVYSLGATNVDLGPYKPPKIFLPDKDGNFPAGIPANAGDPYYERPAGYWSGGRDWDNVAKSDYSHAKIVAGGDNTSTAGLISDSGGVQTRLPPNSRHFILGPIVDGYVYNHGYDNYTNIGYLQKDTRQFVLLGRIYGQWKSGVINNTDNVWNGTSFTAYNPEFTLEMAQWIKTEIDANRFYKDVPYHYSGGVPQQQPNWLENLFNGMFGGLGFGGGGNGGSASDAKPGAGGYGSGGQPDIGQQRDPDSEDNHGNSGDNNLWGNIWDDLKDKFGDVADDVKDRIADAWDDLKDFAGQLPPPAYEVSANIANSILSNKPIQQDNSNYPPSDIDNLVDNLDPTSVPTSNQQVNYSDDNFYVDDSGQVHAHTPETIAQYPNQTGPVSSNFPTNVWSAIAQGVGYNNPIAAAGEAQTQFVIPDDGSEPYFLYTDHAYHNTSSSNPAEISNPVTNFLSGVVHAASDLIYGTTPDSPNTGAMSGYPPNIAGDVETNIKIPYSDLPSNYQDHIQSQGYNPSISASPNSPDPVKPGDVPTAPSSPYLPGKSPYNVAASPNSPDPVKPGEVPTAPSSPYLPGKSPYKVAANKNVKKKNKVLSADYKQLENELLSEDKLRILKEIKKPVVLIEASPKMTKLKGYRPNFKGKFTPQNTPDVTACKKSDELALGANARGQKWREEDKYWKGYETTERMNVIHDRMGHSSMAWDAIIDEARNKNGWKNREIQEQLNRYYALKAERELGYIQEEEDPNQDEIDKYMKDPLVKRVRKRLLTQIDYLDKPSKKGYPDQPPEQLAPNGFHAKYGKKAGYYKKLDPVSALAMPTQGDPEIDAEVEKQKKKYVKPKVTEEWKSDWRDNISSD